jgi:hypothetical protein
MANKKTDPRKRFFDKVRINNIIYPYCWEWIGGKYHNGYGQFFDGKNKITAHRFSYKEYKGPIKKGLNVCHTCDNRWCVNPDHLFLGTQKENLQDMYSKNRQNPPDTRGTNNGRSIITSSDVVKMRNLYQNNISVAEIARKFSVSETQTSRIVKRQSWKHI